MSPKAGRSEARGHGAARIGRPAAPEPTPPARLITRRRLIVGGATLITAIAIAYLAAFPVRTYFRQDAATHQADRDLSHLDHQIASLRSRRDALHQDSEIQRLARQDYNLVEPGQEAFALLPAEPPSVQVPRGWPYDNFFSNTP